MDRHQLYATNAERQAAYRARQAGAVLSLLPQVYGEGYTLYQGDALRIVPLLGPFDHCITDPPYEAEAHVDHRVRAYLEGRGPYQAIDFAPITPQQRRFLAGLTCQWLLAFCQPEAVTLYKAVLGTKYRRTPIWQKPDGSPQFTGDRPAMGYESIILKRCRKVLPGS
jgi:site-specific DNA-methyltransferase (adenine-specific)